MCIRDRYIDSWLDAVKDLTPKTIFIDLTLDETKKVCAAIQHYQRHQSLTDFADADFISELEAKISEQIQVSGWDAAFVKTSFRSPKDASISGDAFHTLLKEHILRVAKTDDVPLSDLSDNVLLYAYLNATRFAMRVSNGTEGMALLLQSERVRSDLEFAVQHNDPNVKIVIREWIEMPLSSEYRCFVYKKQLTAISQYFNPINFSDSNVPETIDTCLLYTSDAADE
eukprot:TRINITY_DN4892_c0_g1_i1.p1 TRINITY_DN4892_c0_g1~~TRINITY_DN4892_c0_g1_i1.p1  ORF type:complete len:227 (-),score=28.76 TRINITY_DN4892_c0_g1_i1:13-693(-)